MPFSQPGYLLVSVDACSGKVTKKTSFTKMDAKMQQYLKTGIPKRWARKIRYHCPNSTYLTWTSHYVTMSHTWSTTERYTFLLKSQMCFVNRSMVLLATRGQPQGLVDIAPYLVSFGLAKAADLHSKGKWHLQRVKIIFFSQNLSLWYTRTAASYCRESGTLGLPWWLFTPPLGIATSWAGGWASWAAGAVLAPEFGGLRLYTCNSYSQRPGATQKSHGTTMTNVNYTNELPEKHSCTQIRKHTQPADECELLNL